MKTVGQTDVAVTVGTDAVAHSIADDTLLKGRLRNGDHVAFTVIYNKYRPLVRAVAMRYVRDLRAADDVVQHVFMRLWEARMFVRDEFDIRNFLYTMGRNRVLNILRDHMAAMTNNYKAMQEQPQVSYSSELDEYDFAEEFRRALCKLPERQREVCRLRLACGLDTRETADRMGVSADTVKTLLRLGKAKIRACMNRGGVKIKSVCFCLPRRAATFRAARLWRRQTAA